ncbi:MAG: hypothetical protein PHE93_03680 [Clostridia bacterium]|nr:hypothetical protein [Clostridia bacterium]
MLGLGNNIRLSWELLAGLNLINALYNNLDNNTKLGLDNCALLVSAVAP